MSEETEILVQPSVAGAVAVKDPTQEEACHRDPDTSAEVTFNLIVR